MRDHEVWATVTQGPASGAVRVWRLAAGPGEPELVVVRDDPAFGQPHRHPALRYELCDALSWTAGSRQPSVVASVEAAGRDTGWMPLEEVLLKPQLGVYLTEFGYRDGKVTDAVVSEDVIDVLPVVIDRIRSPRMFLFTKELEQVVRAQCAMNGAARAFNAPFDVKCSVKDGDLDRIVEVFLGGKLDLDEPATPINQLAPSVRQMAAERLQAAVEHVQAVVSQPRADDVPRERGG